MKKWKYIVYSLCALIAVDQIARYYAEENFWEDRDSFFDDVLFNADLSKMSLDFSYEICERHRIILGYSAKTCFERKSWTLSEIDDGEEIIIAMLYWPPRSHITSLFENWWYYDIVHSVKTIMFVTQDKMIAEDLREG